MAPLSDTLPLPETVFRLLRDLIRERLGACYDDGKRDILADKLSPAVLDRGLASFLDYYYLLKYDEAGDEWGRVADLLAVPETYFWREMAPINALAKVIAPAILSETPRHALRIWSAACASGEEPLTIAMALDQAGLLERNPIEITGSDVSPAAIARARGGVYRERSLRALPEALRARYFTQVPGGWRVAPRLHSRVTWRVANLMNEADVAPLAAAQVVFCRNVFIYFAREDVERVLKCLWRHALFPGYLVVGAAESLVRWPHLYELREVEGAFLYARRWEGCRA